METCHQGSIGVVPMCCLERWVFSVGLKMADIPAVLRALGSLSLRWEARTDGRLSQEVQLCVAVSSASFRSSSDLLAGCSWYSAPSLVRCVFHVAVSSLFVLVCRSASPSSSCLTALPLHGSVSQSSQPCSRSPPYVVCSRGYSFKLIFMRWVFLNNLHQPILRLSHSPSYQEYHNVTDWKWNLARSVQV